MQMPDKNRWPLIPDIGLPSYVGPVAIVVWLVVSVCLVWALNHPSDILFYCAPCGGFSLNYIAKRLAGKPTLMDGPTEVSESSPSHVRLLYDLLYVLTLSGSLYVLLGGW
jgi:hypothetical protein